MSNSADEDDVLEEELEKQLKNLLKTEALLGEESHIVRLKLENLKIDFLRWLGKKFQHFLESKGFSGRVGYVSGHRDSGGINPASSNYQDFSEIGRSIFPLTEDHCCLWLRIEFDNFGLLNFIPDKIVILKRIRENRINSESLLAMFNCFSQDLFLMLDTKMEVHKLKW